MFEVKLAPIRPKNVLTPREEEILLYLIKGKNNTEIAKELDISINTVKFHVSSILYKFGVDRRTNVILKAVYDCYVDIIKE